MNILQSLDSYTSAQKWVGTNFIILGAILIVLGLVFTFFVAKSPMATGMKWGTFVAGISIIVGGFGYRSFCDKTHDAAVSLSNENMMEFVKSEHERMEKVDKGFILYQVSFAAFVVAALVVILFVKAPLAKGVAFAIALWFMGLLVIEGFSHSSISTYTNTLRAEVSK